MARPPLRGQTLRRPTAEPAQRALRFQFFRETIAELRKVVWPTREHATRLTILVIIISVAVGIALGAIDFAFSQLLRLLVG